MGVRSELRGVICAGFRRRPCRRATPSKRPSSPGERGRVRCLGGRAFLAGSILLDSLCLRATHPGDAGAPDARPAAVVLVIGGDAADAGVEADGVVLGADAGELGVERGRVADLDQVPPVALQVWCGGQTATSVA